MKEMKGSTRNVCDNARVEILVKTKTGSGMKVQSCGTILTPISVLALDFSIVVVQRLQVLVAIDCSTCQPHVKCSQHADIPDR